jgi:hypothetical protein
MTSLQTGLPHVRRTNHDTLGILDTLSNRDLLAVCGVAAIGLLLTFVLARLFPIGDIASMIALVD